MANLLDEIKRNILASTDLDLLRIATVDATDYRPEAVQIAREELHRRNVLEITPAAYEAARAAQAAAAESDVVEPPAGYAGFWKRLVALVIDVVVVETALFVLGLVWGGVIMVLAGISETGLALWATAMGHIVTTLARILYWAGLESSPLQATLGKLLLHLKVTDLQGNRVSFFRATLRSVAKLFSWLTLGVGFLMAGFTKRKQALHDLAADCLVVNR